DSYPPGIIGGCVAIGSGEYEKGIQVARKLIQLEPDNPFGYVGLATHSLHLDRFAETASALQRAAQRKMESRYFLLHRYYLAFCTGDQAGVEREVSQARGNPGAEEVMSHQQALVLARSGHMEQAVMMWQRAISLARQLEHWEKAALYES